tara:strand:+ start:1585 stop:1791 length:207 start_codon:yes stop_codon:yes gene_type:complete
MIDIPTAYEQRLNLFYENSMDDYLSYGDSLKKLANFLWEGQIERTDNSMTDLILDETDLCDMKIITTN